MSTRKKIILSIIAGALVIVAATASVFALQSTSFSISNNITFSATSINCDIAVTAAVKDTSTNSVVSYINGYTSSDFTSSGNGSISTSFTYADVQAGSTKSATYSDYTLAKNQKVQYVITIQNTGSTEFYINLAETLGNGNTNMTVSYKYTDATHTDTSTTPSTFPYRQGASNPLTDSSSVTITIEVTVTNQALDANGSFSWAFNMYASA